MRSSTPLWHPASDAARARARATRQRRLRWGKEAALATVGAIAIGGFLAIARTFASHRLRTFDRVALRGLGRTRRRLGVVIAKSVTFMGAVPGISAVCLGALAMTRQRPRHAVQVAAGALGGIIAELGLKRVFLRPRPTLLAQLEAVTSTSFPSGHSMAAASFYLTLAFVAGRSPRLRAWRAPLLLGGGALAGGIGLTRVYLGVHWPTDVLGGLALGTAWACATEAVCDLGLPAAMPDPATT